MVMHAKSGLNQAAGDIEVMGLMQGYPVGNTMYVMDAFGLPVEGTETRVNAGKEADEYMIAQLRFSRERVLRSLPGYRPAQPSVHPEDLSSSADAIGAERGRTGQRYARRRDLPSCLQPTMHRSL